MSKVQRVVIEFDDKIRILEGVEAEKYAQHFKLIHNVAMANGKSPFEDDPPKAKVFIKEKI